MTAANTMIKYGMGTEKDGEIGAESGQVSLQGSDKQTLSHAPLS